MHDLPDVTVRLERVGSTTQDSRGYEVRDRCKGHRSDREHIDQMEGRTLVICTLKGAEAMSGHAKRPNAVFRKMSTRMLRVTVSFSQTRTNSMRFWWYVTVQEHRWAISDWFAAKNSCRSGSRNQRRYAEHTLYAHWPVWKTGSVTTSPVFVYLHTHLFGHFGLVSVTTVLLAGIVSIAPKPATKLNEC
jgi:hypothetical protein